MFVTFYSWNQTTVSMSYGISGGPVAIFDQEGNTVIIAPFSQFMASSVTHPDFDNSVGWGVMGGVQSVPPGYQCDTILYYAKGINKVLLCNAELLPFYCMYIETKSVQPRLIPFCLNAVSISKRTKLYRFSIYR